MVSAEKFEGVVTELNQTLEREKQAQRLLDEQSERLRELSRRLSDEELKRSQHESQLKESLQVITVDSCLSPNCDSLEVAAVLELCQ